MTPNEITTLIASNMKRELDVPFKLQLMERVKYWRSRLIDNTLSKDPSQRAFYRQTVYLKMVQQSLVPCAELINCKVATTENPLPKIIPAGGMLFDYVGGADLKSPFEYIQPGTGAYRHSKFKHLFAGYEYVNDHVVTDKSDLPLIAVTTIFDDPQEALQASCNATGTSCDTWNEEFPCTGKIMQLIVQSILTVDYRQPDIQPTEEVKS